MKAHKHSTLVAVVSDDATLKRMQFLEVTLITLVAIWSGSVLAVSASALI
ncbi:MAG: hypothetical protein VW258_05595 [Thalassolituus sp.]